MKSFYLSLFLIFNLLNIGYSQKLSAEKVVELNTCVSNIFDLGNDYRLVEYTYPNNSKVWWFLFEDDFIASVPGYYHSIQKIEVTSDKVELLVFGSQSDDFPSFFTAHITFNKSSHTFTVKEIYTFSEDNFNFGDGVEIKCASLEQGQFILSGQDGQFYLGMPDLENPTQEDLITYPMFQFHDPAPGMFLEVLSVTPDNVFPVTLLYLTENSFHKLTMEFDNYTVEEVLDVQGIISIKPLSSSQYVLIFDQNYLIVDQNLNVLFNGNYDFTSNPIFYLTNNHLNILKYQHAGNGIIDVLIETLDMSNPSNGVIQSFAFQTHIHSIQHFSIQPDFLHLYGFIGLQTTEQKYTLAEPFVFEATGSDIEVLKFEVLSAEPGVSEPDNMRVTLQIDIENTGSVDIESIRSHYLIPNTIFGHFYNERTFHSNLLIGETVSFQFNINEKLDKRIIGDSIQYTLPCIYFYPWQTIPDTNLTNNGICNFTFSLLSSNITDQIILPTTAYYPNPFTDQITVDLDHSNPISVLIYNVSGQLVHSSVQTPQGNQMQLHLDFLSPGIYHMHLVDSNNNPSYKPIRLVKKE